MTDPHKPSAEAGSTPGQSAPAQHVPPQPAPGSAPGPHVPSEPGAGPAPHVPPQPAPGSGPGQHVSPQQGAGPGTPKAWSGDALGRPPAGPLTGPVAGGPGWAGQWGTPPVAAGPYPPRPPAPPSALRRRWPGPAGAADPMVLAAVAAAAAVAASVVPFDRPGAGWLLASLVGAGALVTAAVVRRRTADSPGRAGGSRPAAATATATATDRPTGPTGPTGPGSTGSPIDTAAQVKPTEPGSPAASQPSAATGPGNQPATSVGPAGAAARPAVGAGPAEGVPGGVGAPTAATTSPAGAGAPTAATTSPAGAGAPTAASAPASAGAGHGGSDHVRPGATGAPGRAVRLAWAVATLALVGVGSVRAAGWLFVLCLLASVATAGLALSGGRTPLGMLVSTVLPPVATAPTVRRLEWALPLAALDALFAAFVLVQLTVLFGGSDHVLRTAGLSYAQYARGGFWQLLAVSALTLLVIGGALRWAPRGDRTDRVLIRVLLGLLTALSLVVVASALYRMQVYTEAYGATRLRLFVATVELWLGLLFVLVGVGVLRLRGGWLPQLVVGTAIAALLGLAVINPDRFIAEHNVDRYRETGRLDVVYLAGLSADAVPALDRLPEPLRSCALRRLAAAQPETDLGTANLGRARARALFAARPVSDRASCLDAYRW